MEWLVISLLALWFAATVAYQIWFARLLPWVRRFDYFRVLPSWRLFSTVVPDLRLYYRDRDGSGSFSAWLEIPMRRGDRPWRALWNPDLIFPDAQLSFMEFLTTAVRSPSPPAPEKIRFSAAWQALSIASAGQPQSPQSTERQFEIRECPLGGTSADESGVYTSAFVPLPRL